MSRNFREMLDRQWERGRFVCVGLDPDIAKIPESARMSGVRDTILNFNRAIIDATKDIVSTYKPNSAFYEEHGDEGWDALRATIRYILDEVPEVPVILDAKRADIGNTNTAYARAAFDHLQADAITVNPYLGGEPLAPFLERAEKGVIVLCHTSNPGAGEIQNLEVASASGQSGENEPLYKVVARLASKEWNAKGNCCVMVGATYPEELGEVRAIVGDMPILVAGIGAQDGHLENTIQAGIDSRKRGLIVNASRSIIYASRESDFAEIARSKTQELDAAIRRVL
ncbi:MAG: orotidine-5'-phosphate decarboxylase [Patescibacteria group bacterium]|nr:orotidine-5'-phosphate decarboxylase [Patescibacteria group bacterium]